MWQTQAGWQQSSVYPAWRTQLGRLWHMLGAQPRKSTANDVSGCFSIISAMLENDSTCKLYGTMAEVTEDAKRDDKSPMLHIPHALPRASFLPAALPGMLHPEPRVGLDSFVQLTSRRLAPATPSRGADPSEARPLEAPPASAPACRSVILCHLPA